MWVRVSRSFPCPVCGRPDWCSVSENGETVKCMRVASDSSKEDATGATYFLHRMTDHVEVPSHAPRAAAAPAELAGEGDRDRAYRALISRLQLVVGHQQDLRRRGLSSEQLLTRGYRSWPPFARRREICEWVGRVTGGIDLRTVPGFVMGKFGGLTLAGGEDAYGIPCRDVEGRIVGMQLRHDRPELGSKYVFLLSTKHGGPSPGYLTHVPLHTGSTAEVRVTEGFLKSDVATALGGVLTIGMSNCSAYRQLPPILTGLGVRRVALCPDADVRSNPLVSRGTLATAAALQGAGFEVSIEGWPPSCGKGIDDVLAGGRAEEIRRYAGARLGGALRSIAAQAGVSVPGELAAV